MKLKNKCPKYRSMSGRNLLGLPILCLTIVLITISCKKLVDVDTPTTSLTGQNTYGNNGTAASVLTGIYGWMGSGGLYTGYNGISLRCGLSSDELVPWNGAFNGGAYQQLYQNKLSAHMPITPYYWQDYYQRLLTINSAIEGIEASNNLTEAIKKQLLGEAHFLRAFFHFYLVNFYGDVPLATTSDWRVNAIASRTQKKDVYQQIIDDLKRAESLLSEKYLQSDALTAYANGSEERVRPTKWAAAALLARVYLYTEHWADAEAQSTLVLDYNATFHLNNLELAFSRNNPEAIWQIQYVNTNWNTEGFHFILTEEPGFMRPTYLSDFLVNAFEAGDERKKRWVGSFSGNSNTYNFPYKYKSQVDPNNSEYLMVLRLAEQYLIRAEARVQLNKINEAKDDINIIRSRAGLSGITVNDKDSLLAVILHERQVELFTEWGHRWFDLKRTGAIDSVMNVVYQIKKAGGTWNSNWQLFPLSDIDIMLNPSLAPNNPGY